MALLLFIFFIALTFVAQLLFIFRSWDLLKAVQFGLLAGVFLLPIVLVFASQAFWSSLENLKKYSILWVILLAIGLRLVLIPLISTDFVSDMKDIHLFATDIYQGRPFANLKQYRYIPHATYLTLTGMVLSFVYKLFGASTTVAKLFLAFLSVLTTWLVYLTGRELGDRRAGFVAALLYATLPSLICYAGVLVGDHLALPLLVLAVLLYARLVKSGQDNMRRSLPGYAACGIVIGLVDWFRPIGLILLVALILVMLLHQFRKQTFFQVGLALLVLATSYFTVSKFAVVITENVFHVRAFSTFERIGGYILTGLNPDSRGNVTIDDGRIIGETYRDYGTDYAGANRYLIAYAFNRLEEGQLGKLLIEKFDLIWANHIALFDYALAGSNDREFVYLLADFESALFLAVTLLILAGAVTAVIRKSHPAILTMQLFLLGFGLLMLVLEAQNRYVTVVLPYSILLGALGLKDAFSWKARDQLPSD